MQSSNNHARIAEAVCLISLLILGRTVWAQEPPSLEEIIEGLERVEKDFFESDSFLIRYERMKAQDLNDPSSNDSLKWLLAEWTFAHHGDNWYNARRFTNPYKSKKIYVPAEPSIQIAKGRFILEWKKDNKSAIVDYPDRYRNIYRGLLYTINLSLDAPKYIAKSTGNDLAALRKEPSLTEELSLPFLPRFLYKNKTHYKVLPVPEKVDDVLCWVVEWPGMDRFWVDPKRGFAVPRRIYHWGPGKPLEAELRHRDYREVKPGLWLPFSSTRYGYASLSSTDQALWGKLMFQLNYIVHSIEFDHLPEDFFEIKLPPGTRVNDCVRGIQYKVSDNTDPFYAAIAEAKKLQRRSVYYWLLFVGAVVTLVIFLIYWMRKRIKLRNNRRAFSS